MANLERKQVGKVGDAVAAQQTRTTTPVQPINGLMHGDVKDLTPTGVNFDVR